MFYLLSMWDSLIKVKWKNIVYYQYEDSLLKVRWKTLSYYWYKWLYADQKDRYYLLSVLIVVGVNIEKKTLSYYWYK